MSHLAEDLHSQAVDHQLDDLLTRAFNTLTSTLKRPTVSREPDRTTRYCSYDLLLDDCQIYATLRDTLTPNDFQLLQVAYTRELTTDHIHTTYTTLLPLISRFTHHGYQHIPARFATIAILAACRQRNLFTLALNETPTDLNASQRKALYRVYNSYTKVTRTAIAQARHTAKLVLLHTLTDHLDAPLPATE